MDQEPLVANSIEAGQRFLKEFNSFEQVKYAAWLKEADSGRWYLYILSDHVNDEDVDRAYKKVVQIARSMNAPRIDPFRVRVVAANRPMANRLAKLCEDQAQTTTTPDPLDMRSDFSFEGIYVYQMPIAA